MKKINMGFVAILALFFVLISCSSEMNDDVTLAPNNESIAFTKNQQNSLSVSQIPNNLGNIPVYVFYNSNKVDHLYTLDRAEGNNLNYEDRGVLGSVGDSKSVWPAYSPDYKITRWYNRRNGDRLLTQSNEVDNNSDWVNEGVLGLAARSDYDGNSPVYRYRGRRRSNHFFTTNFNELGNGNSAWVYEGIGFYVRTRIN
ncbi:hypothetical protein IQ37_04325 [Chryseobacterium piperi]|uniref:DUF5648 domain-containing protein n=1 Tax=Chryseobacterium piperi TaxID=558152 RepID=A0A086BL34_9FLAO|nr:hypothetical protein [Chryseobacterium piperi]ASW74605.1 hypothetical protein CJF12_10135 [Chryseobacterium piperi]KFF29648.1 hypothetical protein IQ37_04325 [Chryseobacterium piperi]